MIAASTEAWVKLAFAASAFILASLALVLLIWRDSRPRHDEWQTIVRPQSPPRRTHTRSFEHRHFDVRDHEDDEV